MPSINLRFFMLAYLRNKAKKRRQGKRRFWVHEIFQLRKKYGEFHRLVRELQLGDHEFFFRYFRMYPDTFECLLRKVAPLLLKSNTRRESIQPDERLAAALRYLVTGDAQQTIGFSFRIGFSTMSNIVNEVSNALWSALADEYLKPPSTPNEWRQISREFSELWNFPNCCGALDGKHVVIQAPHNSGSTCYNYKGSYSKVLLAVCSARYRYLLVDIGEDGQQNDSGVFSNCEFGKAMDNNELGFPPACSLPNTDIVLPHVFVGDAIFALSTSLMRPYAGRGLPEDERVFNYRLSRARRTIENTFGITTSRFRIFRRPIIASSGKVTRIIKAVVVLHNFLMAHESSLPVDARKYCPVGFVDTEDAEANVTAGAWREHVLNDTGLCPLRPVRVRYPFLAKQVRDSFKDYFVSNEGQVSWQLKHVGADGNLPSK